MKLIKVKLTKDIKFTSTPGVYTDIKGGVMYTAGSDLEVHPKYIDRLKAVECIEDVEDADYTKMKKDELIEVAKDKGIKLDGGEKKEEILKLILEK